MLGTLAALVLGAVGGPPHTGGLASLELLARARSAGEGDGVPSAVLELRPSVVGRLTAPRLRLSGGLRPRLFLPLAGTVGARLQHQGGLSAELAVDRSLSLALEGRAAYGYEDFALLPFGARAWALEFRPAPVEDYLSTEASLTGRWTLSQRAVLTVTPGFSVDGAVTAAEQDAVPLQQGPYLGGTFSYTLTRRDLLLTQLWSQAVLTSGDRFAAVVRLWQAWRHELSRTTRLELGAGVGVASRRGTTALLPVVMAAGERDLRVGRRTWEARVETRLLPYLNRLTSEAYERAELSASVTAPVVERWLLRARVGGATELRTGPADRLLLGALEAATPVGPRLEVVLAGNAIWQRLNAPPGPPFHWGVSVSVRGVSSVNRSGVEAVPPGLR